MQTFLPYEDFAASAEVLDYRRRGYNDTMLQRFFDLLIPAEVKLPAWLGDPDFYSPIFPDVGPELDYVWPV